MRPSVDENLVEFQVLFTLFGVVVGPEIVHVHQRVAPFVRVQHQCVANRAHRAPTTPFLALDQIEQGSLLELSLQVRPALAIRILLYGPDILAYNIVGREALGSEQTHTGPFVQARVCEAHGRVALVHDLPYFIPVWLKPVQNLDNLSGDIIRDLPVAATQHRVCDVARPPPVFHSDITHTLCKLTELLSECQFVGGQQLVQVHTTVQLLGSLGVDLVLEVLILVYLVCAVQLQVAGLFPAVCPAQRRHPLH
mmetsp:Transcript_28085/g.55254  ORF Transcript_28085/g.55254 Transcript_28085/m.55254 type:complete len:252 (-) Transcript_28085:1034-1789(-)